METFTIKGKTYTCKSQNVRVGSIVRYCVGDCVPSSIIAKITKIYKEKCKWDGKIRTKFEMVDAKTGEHCGASLPENVISVIQY